MFKVAGPGLFRLFLALAVFVHHTTRLAVGTSAVYIFFTLSGYWIYKMYLGRYETTRYPYYTYLVSRIWRLLPTFLLVTFLILSYHYFHGGLTPYWDDTSPAHFLFSNLFILGYCSLKKPPLVPAWSLDIEMQFYLIAPLLVSLLARRKIAFGWILTSAAAITLASLHFHVPDSILNYIVFFLIGMNFASVNWRPAAGYAALSLGGATLLLLCCLISPWRGLFLLGAHPGPLALYNPFANVVLALLTVPYAIYTTSQKGFKADAMFADLSYIVYLLHYIAALWLGSRPGGLVHKLGDMAAAWIVVIGLSYLIWKFYDHPINQMRSQWVKKRKKFVPTQPRKTE
jgi:peptidoglycan/LPS O-acetylase OafA/YrhL